MGQPIQSFAAFWPRYLAQHRSPRARALHYIGTLSALALAGDLRMLALFLTGRLGAELRRTGLDKGSGYG